MGFAMFGYPEAVDTIAHVIQVALTPVFLLTGIASLLGVFSGRLARVADRADDLEERLETASERELPRLRRRLRYLHRRSLVLDAAVVLGALAGIATSLAAVMLFVGTLRNETGANLLFGAFGSALVFTGGALAFFLVEMLIASRGIRDQVAAEAAGSEAGEASPEANSNEVHPPAEG
jgi:hypothetical protein